MSRCPFAPRAPRGSDREAARVEVLSNHVVASPSKARGKAVELTQVGDESGFLSETGESRFLSYMDEMHAKTPHEVGVSYYKSYRPDAKNEIVESKVYLVTRPSFIKEIMDAEVEHYLWGGIRPASESFFGPRVLFCLEGKEWQDLRQAMRPVLTPTHVPEHTAHIAEAGAALVRKLRTCESGMVHNVLRCFQTFHLQAASAAFYTTPLEAVASYPEKTAFHESFDIMLGELSRRSFAQDPGLMFDYETDNEDNIMWKENRDIVHGEVFKSLEPRLAPGAPAGNSTDLLEGLLKAYKEDFGDTTAAEKMEHLGANLVELLFAGYNTVTVTSSNAVFLLAEHPAILARLRIELEKVLGERMMPTAEDIEKIPYLKHLFFETLRMYSPVAAIARRVTTETRLGNVVLPRDAEVMFPVHALHHDPHSWKDHDVFNPDRWEGKIEPCSWLPFSEGPRRCLGQHYARLFFSVGVATFVRAFDFALAPGYKHSLMFTGFGSTPWDAQAQEPGVKIVVRPRGLNLKMTTSLSKP